MKARKLLFLEFAVFLLLPFSIEHARAQGGCGQQPGIGFKTLCHQTGDYCYSQDCGGTGPPGEFCNEGYGECCGSETYSANETIDTSCCEPQDCPPHFAWDPVNCTCVQASPIIIDTAGEGFHLTSAVDGVAFDIFGDGRPLRIAWTSSATRNAFLALDRNHNGKIDDGDELFGNVTPQPKSGDPNGFSALAVFDKAENGGNDDGIIDERDAVFSHLVLWIDENHDGVSQPAEMHSLPDLGIYSLALKYRESRRTDEFGNEFRYKSAINPDTGDGESKDGRLTYDVFFMIDKTQAVARRRQLQLPDRACGATTWRLKDPFDVEDWRLDGGLSGSSYHKEMSNEGH